MRIKHPSGSRQSTVEGGLFNEAEALAHLSQSAPDRILIPAHERKKRGRKPLSPELPRIEVVHDLARS
jgi:transposase